MTGPRIGSLFSGYGGLDMGVQAVIGGSVAWHVEFADAPSKILAHHWPDVPNYGDITAVDWSSVEPVDVLTGGFPCQDLSLAGRRAGMRDGTRSGLWADYLKAIDVLRPKLVVIENVRGLLSGCAESEADSDLGPCPRCADPSSRADHAPNVRALNRVQLDLARLGYVGRWGGVRAADAGAPHNRFRVFVVAYPDSDLRRRDGRSARREEEREGRQSTGGHRTELRGGADSVSHTNDFGGIWSGSVRDRRSDDGGIDANPAGARRGGREDAGAGRADAGSGAWSLESERSGVRPVGYADDSGLEGRPVPGERASERPAGPDGVGADAWGRFWPAVQRWERVLGRIAPSATKPDGKEGKSRLSAEFVEWMMGLASGHVTAPEIGLTRTEQLKALGNGVVWLQAALALSILLGGLPRKEKSDE